MQRLQNAGNTLEIVADGAEAVRRVWEEEQHPRLPIIAVTAHALDGEEQRCREAGGDD